MISISNCIRLLLYALSGLSWAILVYFIDFVIVNNSPTINLIISSIITGLVIGLMTEFLHKRKFISTVLSSPIIMSSAAGIFLLIMHVLSLEMTFNDGGIVLMTMIFLLFPPYIILSILVILNMALIRAVYLKYVSDYTVKSSVFKT
jgi:hypothetical protein